MNIDVLKLVHNELDAASREKISREISESAELRRELGELSALDKKLRAAFDGVKLAAAPAPAKSPDAPRAKFERARTLLERGGFWFKGAFAAAAAALLGFAVWGARGFLNDATPTAREPLSLFVVSYKPNLENPSAAPQNVFAAASEVPFKSVAKLRSFSPEVPAFSVQADFPPVLPLVPGIRPELFGEIFDASWGADGGLNFYGENPEEPFVMPLLDTVKILPATPEKQDR